MSAMPTITGRTVKVGTKSFASMEEELRRLHAELGAAQDVPAGAFSTIQYAKANKLSLGQAYQLCKRSTEKGLMEQFSLRAKNERGLVRLQQFFRVKR